MLNLEDTSPTLYIILKQRVRDLLFEKVEGSFYNGNGNHGNEVLLISQYKSHAGLILPR